MSSPNDRLEVGKALVQNDRKAEDSPGPKLRPASGLAGQTSTTIL